MEMSVETGLFPHGILTEKSDVRAHVGVLAKTVYVFKTANGIRAILKHHPETLPAFQPGVKGKTAEGYVVKLNQIDGLRSIKLAHWPVWDGWTDALSTSEKGKRAVDLVCNMLERGVFPLWVKARDDERKDVQIKGTDVVVFCKQQIQVKCDYRAGTGHDLCTGNLYLQIAERNPLKRI
jgi:hypothetical protein